MSTLAHIHDVSLFARGPTIELSTVQLIVERENIIVKREISPILDTITHSFQFIIGKAAIVTDSLSALSQIVAGKEVKLSDAVTHAVNVIASIAQTILDDFFLRKQSGQPISDVSNPGGWSDVETGDNDGFLFDELDGIVSDDNNSIALTNPAPTIADYLEVALSSTLFEPNQNHGHKILIRIKGDPGLKVKVQLYEGITFISEGGNFTLSGEYTTHEVYLDSTEIETITDYTNLRIRIVPSVV